MENWIVHAGAEVVLGDFVIPPIAGEAEGIFYRGSAALVVKERAERVVGVVILHRARFVDEHSNAAQAVVQVVIYGGGLIAIVLGEDLVVGVDVGFGDGVVGSIMSLRLP